MSGTVPKVPGVEILLLGPLEVRAAGAAVGLGAPKQRMVLALLSTHAGQVVGLADIVDELWPDGPPASAVANVRGYAGSLRRMFESVEGRQGRLVRRGSGYQLDATPGELDLLAFSACVREGRAALRSGDLAAAVTQFSAALKPWRGPVLAGMHHGPALAAKCAAVEDDRLALTEELAEAYLRLDEPDAAIALLRAHTRAHRLRERGQALLMRALQRTGDVAGALSVYAEARRALVEQLGIEPGRELRDLHQSVLSREHAVGSQAITAASPQGLSRSPGSGQPAPLLAVPAVPAELPADVVDLVGRAAELAEMSQVLAPPEGSAPPICVVVGQPGVGKTSLAVHVAHRLRPRYPDGQLFVDLRGADAHSLAPSEVLARFLRALGVPGPVVPHEPQEREALYRSLLASRRLLVILDNARDEEQVLPMLPGSATCAVLATSRNRLPGLARSTSVDLDVLDVDSGLELLERAAGSARVRAEPDAARGLVRLCGGLPLALRVVGVKLAASPHRTLSTLAERMVEERHRLDQLSHAGLAVRSGLDFSYLRLHRSDQALLRQIALLDAPDFAAWTAAAAADESVPATEDGLDRLIAAHLVQASGPDGLGQLRYRMHDLVKVYGRERAAAEETEVQRVATVRRTVLGWLALVTLAEETLWGRSYLARICREVGPCTPEEGAAARVSALPMAWMDVERAAFVATVRQAAQAGLLAECWRLACASRTVFEHLALLDESLAVHEIALDAARRLGDRRAEGVVLMGLGQLHSEFGRRDSGRATVEEAVAILLAEGDMHGVIRSYRQLALFDRDRGDLAQARLRYATMVAVGRAVDDPGETAMGLRGLAQVHLLDGRPQEAIQLLESALQAGTAAGDSPRHFVLMWYGEACLQLGRRAAAAEAFGDVLVWTRRVGDLAGEVRSLAQLALLAVAEGRLEEAERLATEANDRYQFCPEPVHGLSVRYALARTWFARGAVARAREVAEEILDASRRLANVIYEVRTLDLLAEIHEATGDQAAAATARAEAGRLRPARSTPPMAEVTGA